MSRSTARFVLALVCIALGAGIAFPLIFYTIPQQNEPVLTFALGLVLGWGGMAVQFYFGTSESSSHKNDVLEKALDGPSGNPGDPVHVEDDRPLDLPTPQFGRGE